jgi:CubicO group peptidase (beta-lactamase class C family)
VSPSVDDALHTVLDAPLAAAEGTVAPAIAAVVLRDGQVVFSRAADRVFDLASLTKPLCTADVAMRAVAAGALALDGGHPLLPAGVTVAHLLQHSAGWPAWRALWDAGDRDAVIAASLATPRVAAPGVVHCYSDIGFLALGAVLEAVGGARLDRLWPGPLRWGDPRAEETWCAERGDVVRGTVHDRNAAAMDGVAPHAGLFGTAAEVAACAARWLDGEIPGAATAFTRRGPGTHALGWDTANRDGTSSAGAAPPVDTVGHLGFTGTSVWMSPSRRIVAVLLTNRVRMRTDPAAIRALRRAWYGAVWDALPWTAPASAP